MEAPDVVPPGRCSSGTDACLVGRTVRVALADERADASAFALPIQATLDN
jgi:hypothetical protein